MTEEEKRQDRHEALNNAVRHKNRDETAAEVVQSAELYLKFLQGKD